MSAALRSKLFIAIIIAVPSLINWQLPRDPKTSCGGDQWRCITGDQCIAQEFVCNGLADCADGSDEPHFCSNKAPADECILPNFPENGLWIPNCRGEGCPPTGNSVPHGFKITFSCHEGYSIRGNVSKTCLNGAWYPFGKTTCSDRCLVRASAKLTISCFYDNNWIDCRKPLPPRSVVRFKCRDSQHYFIAGAQENRAECRGGSWTPEFPDSICQPLCGLASRPTDDRSVFPWHAGIYESKEGKGMDFICSGSLISEQVVLSAAHCFRREMPSERRLVNANYKLMKVGLGKLYSGLTDERDAKYQVTADIAKLEVHPYYTGYKDNYMYDISLLFLASPVTLSDAILPVCLDLSGYREEDQLRPGNIGLVPGWGVTENGTTSEILRVAYIPYVDRNECLNNTQLYNFITSDKICGGELKDDAPGVCKGDTGGGYVFADRNTKIFYLRGIVSSGDANCNAKEYSFFTKVSKHSDFINGKLKS